MDDESLAIAERYFADKDANRGPAQQMTTFAEPLLDASDGSSEGLDKALQMGLFYWNLAIASEQDRARMIAKMVASFDDDEARAVFAEMAKLMIARRETLFPELHDR